MAEDCIFCKIIGGEIPSDTLHRDDTVIAIRDISPRAPTHLLVIPLEHITYLDTVSADKKPSWATCSSLEGTWPARKG